MIGEKVQEKSEERVKAEIALTTLENVGPVIARRLVENIGPPEDLFKKKFAELIKVEGIGERVVNAFRSGANKRVVEEEWEFLQKVGARTYFISDKDYPFRLKSCPDAPILLYGKGRLDLAPDRMVSIVGTRRVSDYGKRMCEELISGLKEFGITVVSGLAYGVDIHAHRTAMREGLQTIAVTAHGLDRVYPRSHKKEVREMCRNGGVLTEFPKGVLPERHFFPRRNRIVAGISDCTLVVETGVKGGAMITAELADSYDRDVFAVPGKVGEKFSAGCNRLIKSHKAVMVEEPNDLAYWMNWSDNPFDDRKKDHQKAMFHADLTEEEKLVVTNFRDKGKCSMDELAQDTDLPINKLSTILLSLEFKGVVRAFPGKVYKMVE